VTTPRAGQGGGDLAPSPAVPPATWDTGRLGVWHLKNTWHRFRSRRSGARAEPHDPLQGHHDRLVLHALGVGLEQAMRFLGQNDPAFDAFEQWIVDVTGGVPPERVARINAAMAGQPPPPETAALLARIDAHEPVLSADDLRFWDENGYVILRDAVPEATRLAAMEAILAHRGARLEEPESWYGPHLGIMVQLFQNPAFEANRRAIRVHKAYAQLWGTADLWVTTDRGGFNAPERPDRMFQGPDLHWDISLARPMGFATQGILYLTDTAPEQGAFTCVPGFHRRIDAWLDSLPPGTNPRQQDLRAPGSKPIAGRAGDLVIWHDALPHGSRPNRSDVPRIVQYIAMYPFAPSIAADWV
jgi:hypothetical protein